MLEINYFVQHFARQRLDGWDATNSINNGEHFQRLPGKGIQVLDTRKVMEAVVWWIKEKVYQNTFSLIHLLDSPQALKQTVAFSQTV